MFDVAQGSDAVSLSVAPGRRWWTSHWVLVEAPSRIDRLVEDVLLHHPDYLSTRATRPSSRHRASTGTVVVVAEVMDDHEGSIPRAARQWIAGGASSTSSADCATAAAPEDSRR